MSELSTVATKDGHRGHLPHHHMPLDAERADRISRLAGLERVATAAARHPTQGSFGGSSTGAGGGSLTSGIGAAGAAAVAGGTVNSSFVGGGPGGSSAAASGANAAANIHASNNPTVYFDASNNPQLVRERSTVGSASATGSVGGRTTWASGSDVYDPDKMSEDQEGDNDGDVEIGDAEAETTSSMGGFSDEASSLVAFGEGARTPARQHSTSGVPLGSPSGPKSFSSTTVPGMVRDGPPASPIATSGHPLRQDSRFIDEMTCDADTIDSGDRSQALAGEPAQRSLKGSDSLRKGRLAKSNHKFDGEES